MRKFEFRLEQVLKQREALEELAALQQARAQAEYNNRLQCLEQAKDELERVTRENTPINYAELFNRLAYCDYMGQEVKKKELDLGESDLKLMRCREKLTHAMQERAVLEKLKEKQLLKHRLVVSRQEQKELDDIANRMRLREPV